MINEQPSPLLRIRLLVNKEVLRVVCRLDDLRNVTRYAGSQALGVHDSTAAVAIIPPAQGGFESIL